MKLIKPTSTPPKVLVPRDRSITIKLILNNKK